MKLSTLKIDSATAEAGEWIGNIPNLEDLELKLRNPNSASARAMRHKLIQRLPAKVRNDPDGIPLEVQDEIEAELLAEVILLDWRNAEEPYSKELARKYFFDPDWIEFREAVSRAASRVGRNQAQALETQRGN